MRNGTRKGLAAAQHSYMGREASSTVRSLIEECDNRINLPQIQSELVSYVSSSTHSCKIKPKCFNL